MSRALVPAVAAVIAAAAAFSVVFFTDGDGTGQPADRRAARPGATAAPRADTLTHGREVFARMGCGGCHTFEAAGSQGPVGPNLDSVVQNYEREALAARIVRGGDNEIDYGMMPTDFGKRMNADELDALVAFLLSAKTTPES